jgi:hypothetical protein
MTLVTDVVLQNVLQNREGRGHDRMVVGLIITYAIGACHY